ncbi:hypothetical protein [Bacillus suaedaesalsae]|uniref:Uncharacterized protein n=1 Tax=Bacillus suaedaesalsae TaxID=2810349 RepID=A0ABS2DGB8_9BACI|nr:hypothetical protein [Bacillus suaedaesalsae]MBM6617070.1 hypothetical protein [Bacillus suaedaesalsae]
MYRIVSFIAIFSFVGTMLYYHQLNSHTTASNSHNMHHQQIIEIPKSYPIPTITGNVTQDPTGSWLLSIKTTNFNFTPEKIGSTTKSFNEGHAHLYINGKKINRIYGNYYNIDMLNPGTYHIKITLNGNNHQTFYSGGKEISFEQTLKVSS